MDGFGRGKDDQHLLSIKQCGILHKSHFGESLLLDAAIAYAQLCVEKGIPNNLRRKAFDLIACQEIPPVLKSELFSLLASDELMDVYIQKGEVPYKTDVFSMMCRDLENQLK